MATISISTTFQLKSYTCADCADLPSPIPHSGEISPLLLSKRFSRTFSPPDDNSNESENKDLTPNHSARTTSSCSSTSSKTSPKRDNDPFFWYGREDNDQVRGIINKYTSKLGILKNRQKNSREPIRFIGRIKRQRISSKHCCQYFDVNEEDTRFFTFDEAVVHQRQYLQIGSIMPLISTNYLLTRWSPEGVPSKFVIIKDRFELDVLQDVCKKEKPSYLYCLPHFSQVDIFQHSSSNIGRTVGYADTYNTVLGTCLSELEERYPKQYRESEDEKEERPIPLTPKPVSIKTDLFIRTTSFTPVPIEEASYVLQDDDEDNDEDEDEDEEPRQCSRFEKSREYDYFQSLSSPVYCGGADNVCFNEIEAYSLSLMPQEEEEEEEIDELYEETQETDSDDEEESDSETDDEEDCFVAANPAPPALASKVQHAHKTNTQTSKKLPAKDIVDRDEDDSDDEEDETLWTN